MTLLLLEQRSGDALDRLHEQSEWHGPRLQAASELLTATASLMVEDEDRAVAALRRYLGDQQVHGISTPVLLVPAELRGSLVELATRSVPTEQLARLREVPAPLRFVSARAVLTPREGGRAGGTRRSHGQLLGDRRPISASRPTP